MLWTARLLTAFVALATLLPLLPVGAWWVRVCDFPRLQLAALSAAPLVIAAALGGLDWLGERGLIVAVCLLVLGWQTSHVTRYTALARPEVAPHRDAPGRELLRVVVANLEYTNDQKPAMLQTLRQAQPDLLLLIEADQPWREGLAALREELPHECGEANGEGLGLLLWSRLPLEEAEVRRLISERRPSIHAHVRLPSGGRVRFIGVHPTPPGLRDSTGDQRRDSRVRDAELLVVADEVAKSGQAPCLVTGDFNDVAWSATTRLFRRISGLLDPRVGRGLYNTYPAKHALLRFPIDHVFVSPGFTLDKLATLQLPGSDHFGVVAVVSPPEAGRERPPATPSDIQEAEQMLEEGKQDADARDIKSREAERHSIGGGEDQ